jgi:hypothetical protein
VEPVVASVEVCGLLIVELSTSVVVVGDGWTTDVVCSLVGLSVAIEWVVLVVP